MKASPSSLCSSRRANPERPPQGVALQIDKLLDLAIQIADGVDAAHSKGITHRHTTGVPNHAVEGRAISAIEDTLHPVPVRCMLRAGIPSPKWKFVVSNRYCNEVPIPRRPEKGKDNVKSFSRLLTSLALACSCLAVASAAGAQDHNANGSASVAESVTYQINPTHTGAIKMAGLGWPLTVKWSVDLGAPVSYPLIACGRVFVLAGPDGLGDVNLYALDGQTGAVDWGPVLIPEGTYWWAAAAYDRGKVFVVPDTSNPFGEGAMLAFDASTGHELWSVTLSGQYLFNSAPTAVNGVVYTGGAGEAGTVYAVEEKSGKTLWTAGVANGNASSPAVTSTGVYVSYVCPQTYRFKPTTGALIWNYSGPCEGGGGATPVLYEGSLYVRDSLINSDNGAILKASDGTVTGYFNSEFAPAFLGGTVFYTESNSLTAVEISHGVTQWTAAPSKGDSYASPPIVVNQVVYVGTAAGNLEGYNALTGAKIFKVKVGAPISAYETDNYSSPLSGLGAGGGLIVVPATNLVVAIGK
jgi:outer membrane protein assembly factor BamB